MAFTVIAGYFFKYNFIKKLIVLLLSYYHIGILTHCHIIILAHYSNL
jgi:hypothetical protein